jgi:DNA-binding response OmpR family regulator
MAKVLIVEDEDGFRRQLQIGLSVTGHEIRCASSGREAVDVGVRYRPDLLVTDWMLKDDIHGMHVVHVLRAVLVELRAILITGFASADLREEAGSADVLEFIEKPFTLERIRKAVGQALDCPAPARQRATLAAIEVAEEGRIVHANDKALEMFDDTRAGRRVDRLSDLFPADSDLNLDEAMDHWKVVRPSADRKIAWHLRTQEPNDDGSRLVILRRSDEPQYLGLPVIEMLLGSLSPRYAQWPFDSRVVVVDRDAATRRWLVSTIENAGGGCYAVASAGEALRLLGNDSGLQFVILDYDTVSHELPEVIEQIRRLRPEVVVVGDSPADHRKAFADGGAPLFLQRPWRADNLIGLLTGRIGNCVECGMPLPLRRARQAEQADSWICSNCGAAYHAVIDEEAASDMMMNVRRREGDRSA